MLVRDVMSDRLVCCLPSDNIHEAAYKMLTADCGAVPVVNDMIEKRLLGVITDRDIVCRTIARGGNPLSARVDECMSHEVITVSADSLLDSCCQLMRKYQLRRVLVLDQDDRCCGIVSQADVALTAPREIAEIVRSTSQPRLESTKPLHELTHR